MALALAEAGAHILCAARTREQIEATAREVQALGRRAIAVPTDVRDSAQVNAMVARCLEEFGRVDIMISNAGGPGLADGKLPWEASDADWRDSIDINLSSAFYCARAVARPMMEQGGGVIINVSSTLGFHGERSLNIWGYGAAKAGLLGLTRHLALILAPYRIRVNCIVPGLMGRGAARTEEEYQNLVSRGPRLPLGRLGRDEEIGALAVFLASEASSYITGHIFASDGGLLISGYAPAGFAPQVPLPEGL